METQRISKKRFSFLPNLLTELRIVLTCIIIYLLCKNFTTLPFLLYLLAVVTDFFDGFIARRQNSISQLGKWLDPLADKILHIPIFLIFAFKFQIAPLWIAFGAMLTFAIILLSLVIVVKILPEKYSYEVGSNQYGKFKMATEVASAICFFMALTSTTGAFHAMFLVSLGIILLIISTCLALLSIWGHIKSPK
ncbi:MAG: hypothetical protein COV29_00745 [Candidatus Yanofskybacteria bacterium CG10_big_fil_rev_8_21_14_0_10_36_16]|uniref:CDP-diacylglycerol--glycerol-3-phosphate 3-phosphatidyltransferase n=1 Tax=Candidatus Yanofskybacteria bacterium CG10_big_fil_rev_8_21_14_0_10_36_16 TaxID=1975096 RepID=A0A2J0QAT1_9BACT|nr:MAG: hypothetical protein COV29_00745 [Candidatus Yanofskybacteria bacterium CG10_big_fil_rev_8_21_14_0_10_36_16]